MKKLINHTLKPLEEFLLSFEKDTETGWWTITMGIPSKWAYKSTNNIDCQVVVEAEEGSLVKIIPKNEATVIDDLIEFGKIIIETNERMEKMQEEFDNRMKEMKEKLIEEQKLFMDELDEVKDKSFQQRLEAAEDEEDETSIDDETINKRVNIKV